MKYGQPDRYREHAAVAPVWGRGLKFGGVLFSVVDAVVAPVWGRGLKLIYESNRVKMRVVAPVWGRGLKLVAPARSPWTAPSPPYGGVD